ncbi:MULTISPECIES: DUF302 domain-containing protein [Sulfurimonas]|uniref:DUF302 domain-containing protein n=1 Tax=Sulfurimonas TaxID=202746 RepID=UPI0012651D57|nr:DUF302 domain-containing protein [Sulfurimonas indica]
MKKILLFAVALLCAVSLHAKGDLNIFSVDNAKGKITSDTIAKTLEKNGFGIDLISKMNGPFKIQFKQTDFTIFTLMTVHHTKLAADLLVKYPQAGALTPMGVGIYQKKGDNILYVSILTADAQRKILGIDSKILDAIDNDLIKALKIALPGAIMKESEDSLKTAHDLVTTYELDLDGEDWEDAKDEFEMSLEESFKPYGFVTAATQDLTFLDDKIEEVYDFYDTYSICKLKVIYTVAKSRPEASAFAPCTTMVYKKKDEDKIVVGFPSVYNWMSSARVEDKAAKKELLKAQSDFESILKELTE